MNNKSHYRQLIASELKSLRLQAGLTQRQLAARLGISTACYGHYERGDRSFPPELIPRYTQVMGLPGDYLLCPSSRAAPASTDFPPNEEEALLLRTYRRLDGPGKTHLIKTALLEETLIISSFEDLWDNDS